MSKVDSITLGVIWGAFRSITQEMGVALKKTAYSLAVREAGDFSVGLFDGMGRLIAQGNFSPGHLGSMPFVMKNILSECPAHEMKPGDVVIMNDAYLGSGHLPDFYTVAPIFHKDSLVAFAVNCAHHVDVGGAAPGSQAIQNVYDNYAEGIRVLPIKIYREGEMQRDILRLIFDNSRVPDVMEADMMAQFNANRVGESRIPKIFETYGEDTVRQYIEEILERSERATREEIRKMPNGSYSFTDHFDDSGPDTDPIKVHVTVTINDTDIIIDFTGSSPQNRSALNSALNYTHAYCFFILKCLTDPMIPQNAGTIRPIKVIAPEGSFFNPTFPTAVGGRALINQRVVEVLMGAFSQVVPDKVTTAASHWANPNFGGFNPRTGKGFVSYEIVVGGFGARSNKDGCEGMVSAFNLDNVPVEIFETKVPLFIERFDIIRDSAGAGKYRGGCGIRRDIKVLTDDIMFSNLADRHAFHAFGLFGGKTGEKGATTLNPGPGQKTLHSKGCYMLKSGDVVSQILNGAGGYGDPLDRDPAAVGRDVIGEYVSIEMASEQYGVVIDPETMDVDEKATIELRADLRVKRH